MKTFERYLKILIGIVFILLIVGQWIVMNTDINQYVNPVYEYIGVHKNAPSFP